MRGRKKRRDRRMSRLIKMTPEYLDECRKDFEKALQLAKLSDGKLNFTKTFTSGNRKASVYFTPTAWAKMVVLINVFDKEVAWHGVAHRLGEVDGEITPANSECAYIITDILVYPQEVSAATVEMDTAKYATWLMENIEDERFNNIRMQGHSHVRMGTTPSSVDLNHQEEILQMLGDEDFYIFMIWNKMFEKNVKVYDMKENTLFEQGDVTVHILDEIGSMDEFVANAKAMVKDRSYSYQTAYQTQRTTTPAASGPYNPLAPTATNPPATSPTTTPPAAPTTTGGKPRTKVGAGWYGRDAAQQSINGFGWGHNDDNPYGHSSK